MTCSSSHDCSERAAAAVGLFALGAMFGGVLASKSQRRYGRRRRRWSQLTPAEKAAVRDRRRKRRRRKRKAMRTQ